MGQYDNVVAVIFGGGAGSRLFPLTHERSKPAVPLGGTYRLIDVPVSNCINSEITQIFVLTQYNSASLNRHICTDISFFEFLVRLCRSSCGRADAGESRVVPRHRRRRSPSAAAPARLARRYIAHSFGRPSLPDGLPQIPRAPFRHRRRHDDLGHTRAVRTRPKSSAC